MDPASALIGRVIVVGSINVDLVFSVPRLPRAGETVTGGTFARHHGGKGANQAVAAARAGGAVHLIGAVGEDDGGAALDALAAEGVDTAAVTRLPCVPTGHAAVIVDSCGENQIAVAPGANAEVTREHVRASLEDLGVTRRDVIVLCFELADPPLLAAAAAARQADAAVVVNPAPARAYDPELLRRAVITPNRRELAALCAGPGATAPPGTAFPGDTPDPGGPHPGGPEPPADAGPGGTARAAALSLASRTAGRVIATLGADGALLAAGGLAEHFPGHRVEVRDTTGAGDTLTGVLAASLAAGIDVRAALRRAVAAAALAVTSTGAREGMPRRREIDALLAEDAKHQT
jgi:ribokinase